MTTTTTAANGASVQMGGREIRFLPLNWKMLELLQADLDLVATLGVGVRKTVFFAPDERNAILNVVTKAAERANDNVTEEWVKEHMDLSNVGPLLEAVFTTNGFITAEPSGGSDGAGEAQAAGSAS